HFRTGEQRGRTTPLKANKAGVSRGKAAGATFIRESISLTDKPRHSSDSGRVLAKRTYALCSQCYAIGNLRLCRLRSIHPLMNLWRDTAGYNCCLIRERLGRGQKKCCNLPKRISVFWGKWAFDLSCVFE